MGWEEGKVGWGHYGLGRGGGDMFINSAFVAIKFGRVYFSRGRRVVIATRMFSRKSSLPLVDKCTPSETRRFWCPLPNCGCLITWPEGAKMKLAWRFNLDFVFSMSGNFEGCMLRHCKRGNASDQISSALGKRACKNSWNDTKMRLNFLMQTLPMSLAPICIIIQSGVLPTLVKCCSLFLALDKVCPLYPCHQIFTGSPRLTHERFCRRCPKACFIMEDPNIQIWGGSVKTWGKLILCSKWHAIYTG